MATEKKVKPRLPGGFRDYLPSEMIARRRMIEAIREVFERFGFDPLETPGMEHRLTLTGGDPNFRMVIYDTRTSGSRMNFDPDDPDRTALRFDLTVPLARVVAENLGAEVADRRRLRLPFRRYQSGMVWRGEKPQAGRFREFMQFDADVVGTATPVADAEIIALMVATMRALGVERFEVRFNNRKILNGLPTYAGFDAALAPEVLRIIDKLSKIGRDAVLRELIKPPKNAKEGSTETVEGTENEEAAYGLGLSSETAKRIGAFIDLAGTTEELLGRYAALFAGITIAEAGIQELREIVSALRAMDVPEDSWRLDPSLARGLGYYTGPVFETLLLDDPGIGSVFSGGRYDDLVNRFMDGSIPATGASVGVDRLFAALDKLGKMPKVPTLAQVLVTVMDQAAMPEYLAMAGELRNAGIRTILWTGEETSFKAQLAYATAQEIPVVVIVGDRERAAGTVAVKDMRARQQRTVQRAELVSAVKAALGYTQV